MKAVKNRSSEKYAHAIAVLSATLFLHVGLTNAILAQDTKPAQSKEKQTKESKQNQPAQKPQEPVEPTYIIGNRDRLSITFWQQPDLNREVRVGEDGAVSLPVIGEIKAAGLTTSELAKKIIQQMSIYNTPVSQATVTVLEFNSRSIVVSGQVQTPTTLRYEKMPDVWTAILDAGGPLPDADLARVTIVRREGERSNVVNVDLFRIIKGGDLGKAPQLQAGDLVNVPLSTFGTPLELSSSQATTSRKNIFYVFGQVNEQGPRNLDAGMDVLDAIAVAGGYTAEADLENVRVIIKDQQYASIVKVNLAEYIDTGRPARMLLHPEDAIIVPQRREGFWRSTLVTLGTVAPILGAVGTAVLLIDRF
jgi:polysaccharide export outer membrane protein